MTILRDQFLRDALSMILSPYIFKIILLSFRPGRPLMAPEVADLVIVISFIWIALCKKKKKNTLADFKIKKMRDKKKNKKNQQIQY